MSIGRQILICGLSLWALLVSAGVAIYVLHQPSTPFDKSSTVYFNCPASEVKKYEVVRSSEGRITAIYDRQKKEMVSGRRYVEDTTNCIVVKVEERTLEKQDQNFFEIISFGSNNEELY